MLILEFIVLVVDVGELCLEFVVKVIVMDVGFEQMGILVDYFVLCIVGNVVEGIVNLENLFGWIGNDGVFCYCCKSYFVFVVFFFVLQFFNVLVMCEVSEGE